MPIGWIIALGVLALAYVLITRYVGKGGGGIGGAVDNLGDSLSVVTPTGMLNYIEERVKTDGPWQHRNATIKAFMSRPRVA